MSKISTILGPLILFIVYLSLAILVKGRIPDTQTFLNQIEGLYRDHGYYLIFFAAFFEATFLLGFYFPGSTAVLLGAVLARKGVIGLHIVFILGTAGLMSGYILNYFLGRYGWHNILIRLGLGGGLNIAKKRIEKDGTKAILVGYFLPGSASLLSTAAGVLKMPFPKFIAASIIAQSFWSILWGGIAYYFGLTLVEFLIRNFIFILLFVALLWSFGKLRQKYWIKRE